MKKSEKLLKNIVIGLFVLIVLGGIYFAMSVEGTLEPPLETPPNIEELTEE